MNGYLLWAVFTTCGMFAIVYKAVMSAGSELTPWHTTISYLELKPITTAMRFLIGQFGYLFIIGNPAVLGHLLGTDAVGEVTFPSLFISGMLGLASDKVADVFIVAGTFLYKKLNKLFGNGSEDK